MRLECEGGKELLKFCSGDYGAMGLGIDRRFQNRSCWDIPVHDMEIGRSSLRNLTVPIKT